MNHNINTTTLFNSIDYKNPHEYKKSFLLFNRNIGFSVSLDPANAFLRGGGQ